MPEREVWVWLPPGYKERAAAGHRFPVLYAQDGQNKMDSNTSWLDAGNLVQVNDNNDSFQYRDLLCLNQAVRLYRWCDGSCPWQFVQYAAMSPRKKTYDATEMKFNDRLESWAGCHVVAE